MKEFQVTLSKGAMRQIRTSVVEDHFLNKILVGVNNKRRAVQGYRIEPAMVGQGDLSEGHTSVRSTEPKFYTLRGNAETGYQGEVFINVVWTRDSEPPNLDIVRLLVKSLDTKASQYKWEVSAFEGEDWTPPDEVLGNISEEAGYVTVVLPEQKEWESHISHLIGLDEKWEAIRGAIEAGLVSDWEDRQNVALIGPPGCGKSDMLRSLKRALGEDAVLEFDATSMTTAGVIKLLEERTVLPRCVFIEEIEKSPKDATNFMLALADLRAEIRKTTHRDNIQRDINVLVICTVNGKKLFFERASGALASRFTNKLYFKRPDREMLKRILEREVVKIKGDLNWIDPVLDWCDRTNETDPRAVQSLLKTYRQRWVTSTDGITTDAVRILEANSEDQYVGVEDKDVDLSMFDEDED
jgi:energy-coupling factor transporter ATP-binding protein EcfA2